MEDVGPGPVGLDTAVFIDYIDEHPRYLPLLDPLFTAIDGAVLRAVTSALTLLELLVVPYRIGDRELAERYETLLCHSRNLQLLDIDPPLLRATAHLRAVTRARTPDALQLAAALRSRCTAFVTNDRKLPPVPGLRIIQLTN